MRRRPQGVGGHDPNSTAEDSGRRRVSSWEASTLQGHPRQDRDWEHWPGRPESDIRIRHRLKSLFAASDHEEVAGALIDDRSREIEERAEQLQATIADIERRETRTGRLRSAVEEMLRHGSAELDERHAELAALSLDLRSRDEKLRARERDIAVRMQEVGAVELRRAAVERREAAAAEREATLERATGELKNCEVEVAAAEVRLGELDQEITQRQHTLAASQTSVIERERRLRDNEVELDRREAELADRERCAATTISSRHRLRSGAAAVASAPNDHVLYLAGDGYRLVERDGNAPSVAALVDVDGRRFVVHRVGSSPFPDDHRACAYLEPVTPVS